VCVASFNTCDLLARCLRAVLDDTRECPVEIIVVDNASEDGSAAMIRSTFPTVLLIVNPENRLFSVAQNQASAASRGRYVLFLNADTEIRHGTLPSMLAYMDAHPRVGALSGPMYFPDGRLQHTCARFSSERLLVLQHTFVGLVWRGRRRREQAHCRYAGWDRRSERAVDVLPGSFILARREAIEAVGTFDARLRLYFSDEDWCRRVRQAGFEVVYAPLGAVTHVEGASSRQVPAMSRRMYFEDMRRYVEKYEGRRRARRLWVLTRPTYWAQCLAAVVRSASAR
jgi:GT2 family glycosyltransferase